MKIPNYPQRLECWLYKLKFANQVRGDRAFILTRRGEGARADHHAAGPAVVVEQMREMTEAMEGVGRAVDQIKGSRKLKSILEYVLALGNYLNGGTAQGGVYGVKLDVLLKVRTAGMSDAALSGSRARAAVAEAHLQSVAARPQLKTIKGADGKFTLLDFLVKTCETKSPDIMDFAQDFVVSLCTGLD